MHVAMVQLAAWRKLVLNNEKILFEFKLKSN